MKTIRTVLLYLIGFSILLFISLTVFESMKQGVLHNQISLLDFSADEQNVLLSESPMLFWVTVTLHSIVAMGLIWFWLCYFRSFFEFARNRH